MEYNNAKSFFEIDRILGLVNAMNNPFGGCAKFHIRV